jgi:hypothetical protein
VGVVERLDAGGGRAGGGERREQVGERLLHAGVGVEHDVAGAVIDQPDRQRRDQLAAAGLGQHPTTEPGLDEVQLCFLWGPPRYADLRQNLVMG